MDYKGYKLLDTVILVCRDVAEREESTSVFTKHKYYQAYLVDPSNKNQLESARHWAKWTEYGPSLKNEATGKWEREYEIDHEPVEFEFENKDFTLELLDCAGGSSQGGKLSFWNCLVHKENNSFKIGINSELLLDLLKNATFVKGVCQEPLIFVTKNGKVGMTTVGSEMHKNCVEDMNLKKEVKNNATVKYKFGDKLSTATLDEIYLGTLTQYYVLETPQSRYSRSSDMSTWTIKKLAKPISWHIFEAQQVYEAGHTLKINKLSDLMEHYSNEENYYWLSPDRKLKKPKRLVTGTIEIDIIPETFVNELLKASRDFTTFTERFKQSSFLKASNDAKLFECFLYSSFFGFGVEPFELSDDIHKLLSSFGIKYVEE